MKPFLISGAVIFLKVVGKLAPITLPASSSEISILSNEAARVFKLYGRNLIITVTITAIRDDKRVVNDQNRSAPRPKTKPGMIVGTAPKMSSRDLPLTFVL